MPFQSNAFQHSALQTGDSEVIIQLTGVQGTGSIGALGVGIELPGVQATGSIGTLNATQATAGFPAYLPSLGLLWGTTLAGVQGTGAIGALTPSFNITLAGVQGTGAIGTLTPSTDTFVALGGVQGTGSIGAFSPSFSITLSGVAGTGAAGTLGIGGLGGSDPAYLPSISLLLPSGSPDRQAVLTGVSATGSAGVLTPATTGGSDAGYLPSIATLLRASGNVSIPLVGVQATGQTGVFGTIAPFTTPVEGSRRRPMGLVPSGIPYNLRKFYHTARDHTPPSIANDVTVPLTGVQATGAVGTLIPGFSIQLSSNQVAGSAGTLTPIQGTTIELVGVQGTGSVGTLGVSAVQGATFESSRRRKITINPGVTPYNLTKFLRSRRGEVIVNSANATVALTGVQAIGSIGNPTVLMTIALTGVQGTMNTISFVYPDQGTAPTLTGVTAFGTAGRVSPSITVQLTGVSAIGIAGKFTPFQGTVVPLPGVQAAGSIGVFDKSFQFFLNGVTASAQAGTMSPIITGVWEPEPQGGGGAWKPVDQNDTGIWQPVDQSETEDWETEPK